MMLTWGAQIRPHPTLAIALILTTCKGEVGEVDAERVLLRTVQTRGWMGECGRFVGGRADCEQIIEYR